MSNEGSSQQLYEFCYSLCICAHKVFGFFLYLETSVFDIMCNKYVSGNELRAAVFTALKARH